jgi:uncharacterized protein YbjT (DUF2867 family)
MQIVIAGATSATGNAVTRRLVDLCGRDAILCIARPTSNVASLRQMGVGIRPGDVCDPETMKGALSRGSIYVDMTHPRYYPVTVPLVRECGVERAFYITTTGIFSKFHQCSDIYRTGERIIEKSGLVYTILRPSMIYGSSRDRNMNRLIRFLQRTPVFPLFGGGTSKMQPVHYEDLADGIASAIQCTNTEYKAYNLAGPEPLTYRELVETIVARLHHRVLLVPIPTGPAYLAVKSLQWIPGFPINDEQVLRLQEDKVFDVSEAIADLGYRPRSFADGITDEIETLRSSGAI